MDILTTAIITGTNKKSRVDAVMSMSYEKWLSRPTRRAYREPLNVALGLASRRTATLGRYSERGNMNLIGHPVA